MGNWNLLYFYHYHLCFCHYQFGVAFLVRVDMIFQIIQFFSKSVLDMPTKMHHYRRRLLIYQWKQPYFILGIDHLALALFFSSSDNIESLFSSFQDIYWDLSDYKYVALAIVNNMF